MAATTVEPNSGRYWSVILGQRLPMPLAARLGLVVRDGPCTYVTIHHVTIHHVTGEYYVTRMYEPWLSDAMIARICLEAP